MHDQRLYGNFPSYIPALDGIRGAAVLLVITYHFGLLRFGWTGVGLFFVLSGFLITNILLSSRELGLGQYLGRFYWRRALRILPLYFGVVLAVMAVWAITGFPTGAGKQFPWLSTFTYNLYMAVSHRAGLEQTFHHLWSISAEEQFYLLWPIVVWWMGRKGTVGMAIALILAAPILRIYEPALAQSVGIEFDSPGKLIYYLPFGHVDGFAIGGLLAAASQAPWRRSPRLWGWILVIPALLIMVRAVVLYLLGELQEWPIHLGYPMSSVEEGFHIWGYSAAYLAFGGVMIFVLFGGERLWIRRIASWGPARWLGQISYGVYVFHWPLLLVLERIMPLSENLLIRLLQFKVYMIVLVGISYASHRWYESWFLRQKDRFFNSKRPSLHQDAP